MGGVAKHATRATAPEELPPAMLVPRDVASVKKEAVGIGRQAVEDVLAAARTGADVRELEQLAWQFANQLGRQLMATALAERCAQATEADLEARGLAAEAVSIRLDRDYWVNLKTTFGPVTFPWFAYRDRSVPVGTVTRTPARELVLPHFRHLRASELLIEWESRLGSDHPFRQAQEALTFFTHGAATAEDTTIARHMITVSSLVDRNWTYRSPENIAKLLQHRATRDPETDRPLLYASTDAHTLRTYVDETWDAQWKAANGVRLWCVDRFNGAIIHLGGEYTWGDCERVEAIFKWLRDTGRLPAEGRLAGGLNVQLVFVTDGAPWIRDRIVALFPRAVAILDAYHLMEHLADYANLRYGKGSDKAGRFYQQALTAMYGADRHKKAKARKRAGHRKSPSFSGTLSPMPADDAPHAEIRERAPAVDRLLALLDKGSPPKRAAEAHLALLGYILSNAARLDYERWRARGYQIGSGAMESLHRTASQTRLKVAGIRCLPETSQAVFNLRMLRLCGRWEEFWSQPGLAGQIASLSTSGIAQNVQ